MVIVKAKAKAKEKSKADDNTGQVKSGRSGQNSSEFMVPRSVCSELENQ